MALMTRLLKPTAVTAGAGISVVAPASFAMAERANRGIEALRKLNYTPHTGKHTLGHGPLYFAGEPAQRLADLHAAFTSKSTRMVASLRGGYGSNYLLDGLDLRLIARNPKPFFAYSDLTGIQLLLLDKLGLPAFHGPMVAADFDSEDGVHLASFRAALAGEPYSVGAAEGLRTLNRGSARGRLYGGCLSILAALVGTPFEPRTEGKILFLEDTGVKPYQVDRLLWQLRQAGKFNRVRGIVFGEMIDCVSPGAPAELLEQTIMHVFRDFNVPIAIGLRSGHVSRQNVTLTFGVRAELELGKEPQLRLLEAAVSK
jgi:muramoyltetrapeptide carboxypeptidase